MRLFEFDGTTGEEARIQRLKDNAKQARDRAKQLGAQADVSAGQLKAKKAKRQAAAATMPAPAMQGKPGCNR
jgi:hypothetical protein